MKIELFETLQKAIGTVIHCQLMNISIVNAQEGKLTLMLPYSGNILGDTHSGIIDGDVIDGGALTTLMDTACAFAAATTQGDMAMTPTLDLRMDYIKPAVPGLNIIGEARAYQLSHKVIFARGLAYHEGDRGNPIAHCSASFIRIDENQNQMNGGR